MNPYTKKYLEAFELGKIQEHKNMAVFPILCSLDHSPEYMTLKEALEKQVLTITEVDKSGSVPELKVINGGEVPVLLLDGEELAGAKQNRVLNTSILLKPDSDTVIPVSCTEQGRWSYKSTKFSDSGTVMSPSIRSMKADTVARSLETSHSYSSDQGAVWDAIDDLSKEAEVVSETGAMRDVYASKEEAIDSYLETFECLKGQKGLLVLINGEVVGFDFLSLSEVFEKIFAKLVKSYAIEAALKKEKTQKKADKRPAEDFLKETAGAGEKKYQSTGLGWDYRFEGEKVVGSALIHNKKVIHTAFFRVTKNEKTGRMSSVGRRRGYRTGFLNEAD
jgi:hypothetical protein